MRKGSHTGWLLLVLAIPFAAARAEDFQTALASAVGLYENLDYEQALRQLARAKPLSRGAEDDVALALYGGCILADMGRRDEAVATFKVALFLRPDAKLPLKTSPKVAADFEATRLEVKRALAPKPPAPPEPKAAVERPPPAPLPRAPAEPQKADRPEASRSLVAVSMPAEEEATRVIVVEKKAPRLPVYPFLLLGAGALAGGAGAYFGVTSGQQVEQAKAAVYQVDTAAHLEAAGGSATVANILFGAAAASAVGAIIGFASSGGPEPPEGAK